VHPRQAPDGTIRCDCRHRVGSRPFRDFGWPTFKRNDDTQAQDKTCRSLDRKYASLQRTQDDLFGYWSDLKADQSLHLLRASVPVGGRSLTLYEEVDPQKLLGNRVRLHRFLQTLATFLPPGVEPIIVADSGFRIPFFREVERLGWRWVGRVRGRDYVRLGKTWINYKSLFKKATTKAHCLGLGSWVKGDPFAAILVLVRLPKHGRTDKTASGRKARSKKSRKAAQNQRDLY